MTPRLAVGPLLVSTLLLSIIIHETSAIRMPSLFGSRVTKEDAKQDAKDDVPLEYQDHTKPQPDKEEVQTPEKEPPKPPKPTRPPILGGIPHPADHPLHPHNRPDHPLHPDNLPHLPSLPSLPSLPALELPHLPALPPLPSIPHFTRETIHATKTVFVEVTDKVTVHPVCMTVYKVTPPCLPYHPHHGWREGEGEGEAAKGRQGEGEGPAIQPTSAPLIVPTAAADFLDLEPTRILGGEYISDTPAPSEPLDLPVDVDPEDPVEARDLEEGERSGRWVQLTPPIKVEEAVKVKDDQPREEEKEEEPAPAENTGLSPLNMVQHLIQRHPVTHYKTKTLWVTKVEKVLDTRVTATLVAKNCVPTNSHIPYCAGPSHHGHHGGHGAYLEAGVFVSGGFTDKDGHAAGEAQAEHPENNLVVEAAEAEAAKSVEYPEDEATTERETENVQETNVNNE